MNKLTRVLVTLKGKFSESEKLKVERSSLLLETILNSPEFKQEILKADFTGERSDFQNKTNEEIYQTIMEGKELLSPFANYTADITLSLFNPNFWNRHVVGYTYRHKVAQWTNRVFLRFATLARLAGHICHEWSHKLGFSHDHKRTKQRPFSVSYQLNRIIELLAPKFMGDLEEIIPKKKRRSFFGRIGSFFKSLF